jgi:hypothetical protein
VLLTEGRGLPPQFLIGLGHEVIEAQHRELPRLGHRRRLSQGQHACEAGQTSGRGPQKVTPMDMMADLFGTLFPVHTSLLERWR